MLGFELFYSGFDLPPIRKQPCDACEEFSNPITVSTKLFWSTNLDNMFLTFTLRIFIIILFSMRILYVCIVENGQNFITFSFILKMF